MKIKGVRLYGKKDIRLEEFDLPDIARDEIRAKIITDSVCMSTFKLVEMGQEHKRASEDLARNPIITGHEFCGVIEEVGSKWASSYEKGQKFILHTSHMFEDSLYAPGFSFPYFGGNATYINISNAAIQRGCVIPYDSDSYYYGSLAEPMSCIASAFHASYHVNPLTYRHNMGIRDGGKLALLASTGPMGLGAIDYAINGKYHPAVVAVTDIDQEKLHRAKQLFPVEQAAEKGIHLEFFNTGIAEECRKLRQLGGTGYDDVFVMAPVPSLIEQGDTLLGEDGCVNFFAGPTDPQLKAPVNFYNLHYAATHFVGTTGSRLQDMKEVVQGMNGGALDPTFMITHVGGLNCVVETVLNLPHIPGGKKLIYNQIDMPLVALKDLPELERENDFYRQLSHIVTAHHGLWSAEAEQFILCQKAE